MKVRHICIVVMLAVAGILLLARTVVAAEPNTVEGFLADREALHRQLEACSRNPRPLVCRHAHRARLAITAETLRRQSRSRKASRPLPLPPPAPPPPPPLPTRGGLDI